jgi:hypothetical protein
MLAMAAVNARLSHVALLRQHGSCACAGGDVHSVHI